MAEVEEKHHSSGIAKAGLVTGIIGTALSSMNTVSGGNGVLGGLLGGNSKKDEQLNALRDENILLKSAALTNEKSSALEIQVVQLNGKVDTLTQALQFEGTQRQQGDQFTRQWAEDNFIKADKCVPANKLNPPCTLWGTGLPSYANPAFLVPPVGPFGPFVPPFVPPVVPPTTSGTTTTTPEVTNGSGN